MESQNKIDRDSLIVKEAQKATKRTDGENRSSDEKEKKVVNKEKQRVGRYKAEVVLENKIRARNQKYKLR